MALQAESSESRPAPEDTARLVAAGMVERRLVEAARSLMWEAGGTGFTVDQVVAAAGSSLKSFYRCFSSKDELLVALFADDARHGAEALDAMVARRPPAERLRAAVVGLFRFLSVDGQLPYAAALVGEHLRLAQSRPDELAAVRRPFLEIFEREVRAAAERGEIRAGDAEGDARTVFHLVLSHLHALVWHQIEEDPKMLSEQLWAFCSAALRPTTESPTRTATARTESPTRTAPTRTATTRTAAARTGTARTAPAQR